MSHSRQERSEAPTGVGATALGVARLRAIESSRTDRFFRDPYAEDFLTAAAATTRLPNSLSSAPTASREEDFWSVMGDIVAVRTRFFDDYLLDACTAGCWQVVVLAAGLDTRAFRLPWPDDVRIFEVDQQEVLEFKESVLTARDATPACQRTVVSADLRGDWPGALTEAGFRAGEPTAWLIEGLLYALTPEASDQLLNQVGQVTAPGSQLAFDHMHASSRLHQALENLDASLVTLWQGGPDEHPGPWLTRHGWHPGVYGIADYLQTCNRAIPAAFDITTGSASDGWLVQAHRPADTSC